MKECEDCKRYAAFLDDLESGAFVMMESAAKLGNEYARLVHKLYLDMVRHWRAGLAPVTASSAKDNADDDDDAPRKLCKTRARHLERDELFHRSDCHCEHCNFLCACDGGDLL